MKIRSDFVTNSSSSCYVTVIVETADGERYTGYFDGYEINYFDGGIGNNETDFTLRGILSLGNGRELVEHLDALYGGIFTRRDEVYTLFEEYDGPNTKEEALDELGIPGGPCGEEEVEALPVSEIRKLKLIEQRDTSGDYRIYATAEADLEKQEEVIFSHIEYENIRHVLIEYNYEEVRNWKTGEKKVTRKEKLPPGEEDDW